MTLSMSFMLSVTTGSLPAPSVSSPASKLPSGWLVLPQVADDPSAGPDWLVVPEAAALKVGPVARGASTGEVVNEEKAENILVRRSMLSRVPLPYRSCLRAARMRGLLSVSRRRDM
jgi:hypothetical protein